MKKTVGKVFSSVVAATMMLSLFSGCGSKNNTSTSTDTNVSEPTNDTASAQEYMIGGIGPVTGGAAIYGQAVKNAAMIAVEEINANGGVNGYKLNFQFEDDEHDAEKSVNAYNTLKDKGMKLLMGTVTSKPCTAVAAKAAADNMFLLSPSASAVECITNPNAFRVCFSDPNQGGASAEYIGSKNLATKVAVIYNSSDPYSSGIFDTFKAKAAEQSFEIVSEEAFTDDSKTDFTVQLQNAKDAGADLVFLPIYYQEATLILQQAKTMGYEPKFFGCDGLDGILTQEGFDVALAEDVMLLTPFVADAQDAATQKFVESYKAKYNEIPNQFAADAYDAIYAIKLALEKSGVKPDASTSDICEALKKAMLEIKLDGVTGEITWDVSGEPTKTPKAMKIVNGAYQAMD